jgi:hypothetical protein
MNQKIGWIAGQISWFSSGIGERGTPLWLDHIAARFFCQANTRIWIAG